MYNERELLYKETHEDFLMSDILTELAADDGDEDICHARTMGLDGEFTIYPSHLKAYIMLKMKSPELALLYLEDLVAYGITGYHITCNLIVRALIENSEPDLDRQFKKRLKSYISKNEWKKIVNRMKRFVTVKKYLNRQ